VSQTGLPISSPSEGVAMDFNFASIPVSNTSILCIGGITNEQAQDLRDNGVDVDGFGYYLFLADTQNPSAPIEVIAKCFSAAHAEALARNFPEIV
jgi:2-keto-3-deoxy-6-phosphogluconate aldolase